MYVVANRLRVAEGYEEAFVDRFTEQLDQVTGRPGLHQVELLEEVKSDHYVILAHWESEEAFEAWRESEAFQQTHADLPGEMFDGPNQLDRYEVLTRR